MARLAAAVGSIVLVVIVNFIVKVILFIVIVVAGDCILDALGEAIAVQGVGDILVLGNGSQEALVDGLARVSLLNDAQHAVIQMLVEVLRIGEGDRASRASTSHLWAESLARAARALLSAVGWILLHPVD